MSNGKTGGGGKKKKKNTGKHVSRPISHVTEGRKRGKREGLRGCHARRQSIEKSNPLQLPFDLKGSTSRNGFVLGRRAHFQRPIKQASLNQKATS